MRYAGIDVGAETHVVAVVDEQGQVLTPATSCAEDAAGYARLRQVLGPPETAALVALEATGHYWFNLVTTLIADGYPVAALTPRRTASFASGEELQRTKTDAIDAVGLARFAAQKRPAVTRLPDAATAELRELVRLRDRLVQDLGDRVRQLHRLVDLGFPEFPRYVPRLDTELATTLLQAYPTAAAYQRASVKRLAKLVYDGHHRVGPELAEALVTAARQSVGRHHGPAYQVQVRYACEDIAVLRRRLRDLERELEATARRHDLGALLSTIGGLGLLTAARLVAELGNPAAFRSAAALAAYVGPIPGLRQSGKRRAPHGRMVTTGHVRLRAALWMPTLTAVRCNPWLRGYYQGLLARGKPPKVALVACMRKLLTAVYSVAKHRRPFVPQLVNATP
jgi:transposase